MGCKPDASFVMRNTSGSGPSTPAYRGCARSHSSHKRRAPPIPHNALPAHVHDYHRPALQPWQRGVVGVRLARAGETFVRQCVASASSASTSTQLMGVRDRLLLNGARFGEQVGVLLSLLTGDKLVLDVVDVGVLGPLTSRRRSESLSSGSTETR